VLQEQLQRIGRDLARRFLGDRVLVLVVSRHDLDLKVFESVVEVVELRRLEIQLLERAGDLLSGQVALLPAAVQECSRVALGLCRTARRLSFFEDPRLLEPHIRPFAPRIIPREARRFLPKEVLRSHSASGSPTSSRRGRYQLPLSPLNGFTAQISVHTTIAPILSRSCGDVPDSQAAAATAGSASEP